MGAEQHQTKYKTVHKNFQRAHYQCRNRMIIDSWVERWREQSEGELFIILQVIKMTVGWNTSIYALWY